MRKQTETVQGFYCGAFYLLLVLLILIAFPVYPQKPPGFPGINFQPPLKGPLSLSGTFGELRPSHYHSGIDMRTGGKIGLPVFASADGWVSRIKVSSGGFGRALYINHPQGYTSVYGHLHQFIPAVASIMDSMQYANRLYEAEYFPDSTLFPVHAGDLIGWSGNSGSSEAPHLHFEIRERYSEEPLNPLETGWITDTVAPLISDLFFYKKTGRHYELLSKTAFPPARDSVYLDADTVAVGIYTIDPDSNSRLGIYSIEVKTQDSILFAFSWNRFNFNETRFVNAHIDFAWSKQSGERIHRLFKLPGDSCSMLRNTNEGWFVLGDTGCVRISINVSDYNGNSSTASLIFKKIPFNSRVKQNKIKSKEIFAAYDQPFTYEFPGKAVISFPAGSMFQDDTLLIPTGKIKHSPIMLSKPFGFYNPGIAMYKPCTYSCPVPKSLQPYANKLVFAEISKGVLSAAQPVIVKKNIASATMRKLAVVALSIDTIAPSAGITTLYSDTLTKKTYLRIKISENMTGISMVNALVNGSWQPAYYDDRFQWVEIPVPAVGPSSIVLTVKDGCQNILDYESVF